MAMLANLKTTIRRYDMPDIVTVYRYYNEDGDLLYVGRSNNFIARMGQHRIDKSWFLDIDSAKFEHYVGLEAAISQESKAIHNENPIHNIQIPKTSKTRIRAKKYDYMTIRVDRRVDTVINQIEKIGKNTPDVLYSLMVLFLDGGAVFPKSFRFHKYSDWNNIKRVPVKIPVNRKCLRGIAAIKGQSMYHGFAISSLFMIYHLCDYDILKVKDLLNN